MTLHVSWESAGDLECLECLSVFSFQSGSLVYWYSFLMFSERNVSNVVKQTLVCDPNVSAEHFLGWGCVNICNQLGMKTVGNVLGRVAGGETLPASAASMAFGCLLFLHIPCGSAHTVVIPDVSLPVLLPLLLTDDCDLTAQSQCASVSMSGDINGLGYKRWHLKLL